MLAGSSKPTQHEKDFILSDLPWYRWWVMRQVQDQPRDLFLALTETEGEDVQSWEARFFSIWSTIQAQALEPGQKSIDSITDHLVERGMLAVAENYMARQSAKDLVFSVLGWQTMLYRPDFVSDCPGEYNLVNEMDGYTGEAHLSLRQPSISSTRNLSDFLLGFGMMLPPKDYCAFHEDDEKEAFHQTKVITSKDMDAYVLAKVCGVGFQWVDCLSCHLELDKQSDTLFLYRYPSFCVSNLRRHGKDNHGSVLHSCAGDGVPSANWASKEDVTELLKEILLSYRLVFGQNKRSRKLFRKLRPFAGVPREGQDRLLSELCGRKRFISDVTLAERQEYDVSTNFPHLRSRIVRLSGYALTKKPRSFKQLWLDNRDSASWLTFWTVLVFGSISILLGLLQAVFQVLQYVQGI